MLQKSRRPPVTHSFYYNCYYDTFFLLQLLLFNSFVFRVFLILKVYTITSGDTAELLTNDGINKETLERAEEVMQYFKGHKFVLLKLQNFVETGLDILFLNAL